MRQAMTIGAGFGEFLSACPYFIEEEAPPATLRSPGTDASSGCLAVDVSDVGEATAAAA